MEQLILEVEKRTEIGKTKVNALRHQGLIPAVVYSEGKEAISLKISRGQFLKMIHQHQVENAIITLQVKDDDKKGGRSCMIKELQHDPVKGDILHVDFNEISLSKALKVKVSVAPKGEATGVKNDGGVLEHVMWEVEIECLPMDIPKHIDVDISALKIGDSIHIKDIAFPPKVKVLSDPDSIVLHVAAPMKEVVPSEEGEQSAEPEAIKEKKELPAEGAEKADGKDKK
jgi:large subunit ribosomal protein L25